VRLHATTWEPSGSLGGMGRRNAADRQIRRLVLYVHGVVPSVVGAAQVRCRIQLDRLSPA
jgi:hypothetical protein